MTSILRVRIKTPCSANFSKCRADLGERLLSKGSFLVQGGLLQAARRKALKPKAIDPIRRPIIDK
jgi:hypothetical protein